MTKKQEFKEKVEQVIQADSVTQIHHHHGRPLTTQERSAINKKIQLLQDDYGENAGATWNYLKRTIGVAKVDDLCIGHRDAATAIVDLLLDLAKLKRSGTGSPAISGTSSPQNELALAHRKITELTKVEASLLEKLKVAAAAQVNTERAAIEVTAKVKRLEVTNRALAAKLDAANIEKQDLAAKLSREKQATYALASQAQDSAGRRFLLVLSVVGLIAGAVFVINKSASQHIAPPAVVSTLCSIGTYSYSPGTIVKLADAELTCKPGPSGLMWERKDKPVTKPVHPIQRTKSKPVPIEESESDQHSIAWSLDSSEGR